VFLSYGPSEREFFENLAELVDQILKGAKPGDLPVRQPAQFHLLIDLTGAKALGIIVPQSVLMRADYVFR
jgi:putative ABC transport system substrate-binding protein